MYTHSLTLMFMHQHIHSAFFFSCLTDKCQTNTLPDALPALYHMPRAGKV